MTQYTEDTLVQQGCRVGVRGKYKVGRTEKQPQKMA